MHLNLAFQGFLSGVIWAIAQIGWFVASDNLSMVVSFPIICTVPAILANFYGITIFNEIATDKLNLFKLFSGIACSAAAAILISLSKLS
eukprot:SAG31_NODE_426_length_15814_cov_25.737066_2_plen_89_part_00